MAKPKHEGIGISRVLDNNIVLAVESWSKDMEEDINERSTLNGKAEPYMEPKTIKE